MLWTPDFVDPAAYINRLLDGQHAGGTNLARFDEPPYNAQMQQASRLQGAARAKAYAELDLRLARDAAPLVPIAVLNEATLVSARVGCMLRRPGLVLTTVCLKRSGDAPSPGPCLPGRPEPARGRGAPRCAGVDGCAGGRDLPGQLPGLEQPAGVRPRRPGARLHARELGAARHGLRAADALPRHGRRPRATGSCPRSRPPSPTSRPTAKTTTFKLRSGFRFSDGRPVRADAFAHAIDRTMAPGVDSPAYALHPGDRRRRRRQGRQAQPSRRCHRARQHAHRPLHPRSPRLRRLDDDAVLLRRPARRSRPSAEGVRTFPGAGPYTIREYRPQRAHRAQPQPLLRRRARAPRRRLRRRPQRRLTPGSARPDRSRQSRLGVRATRTVLRAATRPDRASTASTTSGSTSGRG